LRSTISTGLKGRKYQAEYWLVSLMLTLLALTARAGAPAIIPLPQQMQVRPGVFTLCPAQPVAGPPAQAVTRILGDFVSQETGQYLAALLFRSTGYQFQVRTNAGVSAAKGAILLTTVNALTNLGTEGYELTVAPDSVVIRAPAGSITVWRCRRMARWPPGATIRKASAASRLDLAMSSQ
jgi:hexosaminidase